MKKKPMHGTGGKNLPDDPEQSKRFEDMARELETDKDREKFEKILGAIMPTKNSPNDKGREE